MSNNQNWPDRVYLFTRHWGSNTSAGKFMGLKNTEFVHPDDEPPNFPAVEYISADKVREIQLATIVKTMEAAFESLKNYCGASDHGSYVRMCQINPESIIEQVKI
jgi:hypothetical protein